MKMPLLYALLAAAVLVLPAAAQQDSAGKQAEAAKQADAAAGAPAAAPAKQDAEAGKLPVPLQKGGAVVFQPDAAGKAKMKVKYKYKGYTKSKGSLEKYKQDALEKRLDKGAVESLDAAKQDKAKDLAAQAELNEDVRQTVKAKLEEAKAKDAAGEEAQKMEAAKQAADSAKGELAKQMEKFERVDAKGRKVFKHPEGAAEPGQPK